VISDIFLRGVIPIAVMPFGENDEIDENALSSQLDFLAEVGIKWIGFGYGSEVYTLAEQELLNVISYAVQSSKGKLDIIGNVELNSAVGGAERVKAIKETGASMAMIRPNGLLATNSQEDLINAFEQVASNGGLPLIIQDAPQNTGVTLTGKTLQHLLDNVPNIVSLKIEPLTPAIKITEIINLLTNKNSSILGGMGGMEFIHELKRGSVGTMPGPAFPEIFSEIQRRMEEGDEGGARDLFKRILPLMVLSGRDMNTFLFTQKYILVKRGILSRTNLRLPHGKLDPNLPNEIDEQLVDLKFDSILKECRG
jgi:dihydrodipicolinate synthase/N-acetylneuraminate lyase